MKPRLRYLFTLIFLCYSLITQAQETKNYLISADFNRASFEQFVKVIEAQTPYHFFYDPSQSDSIIITASVKQVHLNSLLENVLSNYDLRFAIDSKNNVFITKGFSLVISMGEGSSSVNQIAFRNSMQKEPDNVGLNEKKKVVDEISIQNKLFEIGSKTKEFFKGNVNLAGYIREALTGEAISGAIIFVEKPRIQVTSDQFGYFSITLPAGRHSLNVIAPGKFDAKREMALYSDGKFNVDMEEKVVQLKEVRIETGKVKNIRSTTMGSNKLDILSMKQIPAAFGEVDVLRAVLSLPGVKSVGEASTGLNVRGGATDQNLILFNGANIFNPSHLFGFFSAFDPDVVKDVTLYKSSIPANYGGRVSSVLDITSLDGNDKKIAGTAGIGPLTGKITLEGPISKDKTTFVAGVRSTYSNWLFKLLPEEYQKSKASFQDGTFHLSHKINNKNNLFFNGYISSDKFNLNSDTAYQYQNKNINAKWKHNFNNRFYGVLTAGIRSL